jgi:Predicted membrane protein
VYGQINLLTDQIKEKDSELGKERETVRLLSERLKELQETASGFEALAAQNKKILDKLEEQQKEADNRHQKETKDFQQR